MTPDPADVEAVARELATVIFRGTYYDEVPIDEIFRRARYMHLKHRAEASANAAIAALIERGWAKQKEKVNED